MFVFQLFGTMDTHATPRKIHKPNPPFPQKHEVPSWYPHHPSGFE